MCKNKILFLYHFCRLNQNNTTFKYNSMQKESFDNFKTFLKESEGELYLKLWTDIEKLIMCTSEDDQKKYV